MRRSRRRARAAPRCRAASSSIPGETSVQTASPTTPSCIRLSAEVPGARADLQRARERAGPRAEQLLDLAEHLGAPDVAEVDAPLGVVVGRRDVVVAAVDVEDLVRCVRRRHAGRKSRRRLVSAGARRTSTAGIEGRGFGRGAVCSERPQTSRSVRAWRVTRRFGRCTTITSIGAPRQDSESRRFGRSRVDPAPLNARRSPAPSARPTSPPAAAAPAPATAAQPAATATPPPPAPAGSCAPRSRARARPAPAPSRPARARRTSARSGPTRLLGDARPRRVHPRAAVGRQRLVPPAQRVVVVRARVGDPVLGVVARRRARCTERRAANPNWSTTIPGSPSASRSRRTAGVMTPRSSAMIGSAPSAAPAASNSARPGPRRQRPASAWRAPRGTAQ